jgi:membrane protein CcdC involved in cytochrome C biogenesis
MEIARLLEPPALPQSFMYKKQIKAFVLLLAGMMLIDLVCKLLWGCG